MKACIAGLVCEGIGALGCCHASRLCAVDATARLLFLERAAHPHRIACPHFLQEYGTLPSVVSPNTPAKQSDHRCWICTGDCCIGSVATPPYPNCDRPAFLSTQVRRQQTLQAFNAQLREETDLERLTDDMLAAVQTTLQPVHLSLWLREPTEQTNIH